MIQSQFIGALTKSNQTSCWIPLQVTLGYDESDPFAFSMAFDTGDDGVREWLASRELLAEALGRRGLAGEGDVRFRRFYADLQVRIESPEGSAEILFPMKPVKDFVEEMEREAAADMDAAIDEALKEILG